MLISQETKQVRLEMAVCSQVSSISLLQLPSNVSCQLSRTVPSLAAQIAPPSLCLSALFDPNGCAVHVADTCVLDPRRSLCRATFTMGLSPIPRVCAAVNIAHWFRSVAVWTSSSLCTHIDIHKSEPTSSPGSWAYNGSWGGKEGSLCGFGTKQTNKHQQNK